MTSQPIRKLLQNARDQIDRRNQVLIRDSAGMTVCLELCNISTGRPTAGSGSRCPESIQTIDNNNMEGMKTGHVLGVQEVASSNLAGPTKETKDLQRPGLPNPVSGVQVESILPRQGNSPAVLCKTCAGFRGAESGKCADSGRAGEQRLFT
jgi:hypothetical protein